MIKDRDTLVLYVDAVCNLKCRYCFIDKNPALVQIDKLLEESFQDDYYVNFAKEVFPDPRQLTRLEIWGGEPTLYLERAYNVFDGLLSYYPNLDSIFFSTNFTLNDSVDKIYGLIDVMGKYQARNFTLTIQLSIDGPTYINDANRGQGVTEKFTKNYVKMVSTIDKILQKYPNVTVEACFKPTLDDGCIAKLQTREKIVEYFQFFEVYYRLVDDVVKTKERFHYSKSLPNTAEPEPHTQEAGKLFANFCKITNDIEDDMLNEKDFPFTHYRKITIFPSHAPGRPDMWGNHGACGSGRSVIGLLPNRIISTCHNGFTALISDYKKYCEDHAEQINTSLDFSFFQKNFKNPMVFPYEELSKYETQVEEFYQDVHYSQVVNIVGEIQFLAINGQIDRKYTKLQEAFKAANFVLDHSSFCIRDNINTTGCKNMLQPGFLKLFLNGAMDLIKISEEKQL